ncbi:HNH endonuclease [Vibrio phage D148]
MNKLAELLDAARRIGIPGYEDKYDVDETGVVYNKLRDRTVAVDTSNPHGYHRVNLFGPEGRKRMFVHRVVAQAFSGPQWDAQHVVDHINGDKTDNRWDNLEPITQSENTLRAIALGLRTYDKKAP